MYKKITLLILVIILIEVLVLIKPALIQNRKINSDLSKSNEHKLWEEKISSLGADMAYIKFKQEVSSLSPGQQHTLAHVFGETLLDKEDLEGIVVCDGSFAYGCYHSFLGTAIHQRGLKVVDILNEKCLQNPQENLILGCQHGLGHGIVADIGYNFNNLLQSLETCSRLPFSSPIGGCLGGVFMEYNFQTMLAEEGHIRTYDSSNPHFPCSDLKADFRPSCYFWQGQWWGNVLSGDFTEKYKEMDKLCIQVNDLEQQKQCFMGLGNIVGQFSNWDIVQAIKLCDSISSDEGKLLCRATGAGIFFTEPRVKMLAPQLCEGFNNQDKQKCLQIAQI